MATQLAARLRRTTGGWLVGGLALAFGWLLLDASLVRAQDGGQPPRARMLLRSARELFAKGEYETADAYYQQALLGRDSLTPSEQRDLDAQLQQNATALRARREGFDRLCAFTHAPGYFMQMGFSIVPHLWVAEKVYTDCVKCPLFRRCGQHAMVLPLESTDVTHDHHLLTIARHA